MCDGSPSCLHLTIEGKVCVYVGGWVAIHKTLLSFTATSCSSVNNINTLKWKLFQELSKGGCDPVALTMLVFSSHSAEMILVLVCETD